METVYMGDSVLRDCIVNGVNLATCEKISQEEQQQWSARRQATNNNNNDEENGDGERTNLLNNNSNNGNLRKSSSSNHHREKFYQYCFEDYIELVLDKLFDTSRLSDETRPLYGGKLFDAVAFALVDNKRWVEVDDGCELIDEDDENEFGDTIPNNNNHLDDA